MNVRSGSRAALVAACAACIGCAACVHPREPAAATPAAGVSIAVYADATGRNLAVVDDRRWIDVAGDRLVLDDIEPDVAMPTLVLESLAGPGPLALHACARDRVVPAPEALAPAEMPSGLDDNPVPPPPSIRRHRIELSSRLKNARRVEDVDGQLVERTPARDDALPRLELAPTVHCAATGAPGRYLVRLLYTSSALAYNAEHDITLTVPDRARVATSLSITTPIWRARGGAQVTAQVTAYDGLPGGDAQPTEVAAGPLVLDGTVGVLHVPEHTVPAHLRRVLAPSEDVTAGDDTAAWVQQRRANNTVEADALVWVWLELPGTHLAPGGLHVTVSYPGEDHPDIPIAAENRVAASADDPTGATLRVQLWADSDLKASIERAFDGRTDTDLVERFSAVLDNTGDVTREIDIEEHLRPGGRRAVTNASPGKPRLAGNTLRMKVAVSPTRVERAHFVITYDYGAVGARRDDSM